MRAILLIALVLYACKVRFVGRDAGARPADAGLRRAGDPVAARVAVSEPVALSGPRRGATVTVVRNVGQERTAPGGRNPGSPHWVIVHTLEFSDQPYGAQTLLRTMPGRDLATHPLMAARWTVRPSPADACVALRVGDDPRWRYVWLEPDFIACEHVLRSAPDGDPCQAALPLPQLARAMFEGVTGGALHPGAPDLTERAWALTYAAAHADDVPLLTALAGAMVASTRPTSGGGIDLSLSPPAARERLCRAIAAQPTLTRGLVAALRRPRVAWTFAGSNAARAVACTEGEDALRALAPLLPLGIASATDLEDGNFRVAVALALGRIAATRRRAPAAVVRAMAEGLAETAPSTTPTLYLLWGLAALDDRVARAAVADLAARATSTEPWPATFEAFAQRVSRTPTAALPGLAARLARGRVDVP